MRTIRIFLTGLLLVGFASIAKTPKPETWVALFNGRDLTGWKVNGDEKWIVENGTIFCESTVGKYGYLTTEKAFRNFDLRFKFKGEAKGNSGVFFHAMITGNTPATGPDIQGMQVEIDPNMGMHTGGLYESGGRSWVKMPTADGEKALKVGEWNELEVSAQGNHIVTRLNGTTIVDFTDSAPKYADGVIGLQIHTGGGVKMRWKDISIKEN
jgi:hypothetical protein